MVLESSPAPLDAHSRLSHPPDPIAEFEQTQAEAALAASESRYQDIAAKLFLLVERTPIAVVEWNRAFKVVAWNPAAEKIFGYSKGEAIGRHASELILPKGARTQVDQVFQDLLKQQGGFCSTQENLTKDGRVIICEWYDTPLTDADGNILGMISMGLNITKRKQTEVALQTAKAELEARVEERTTALKQTVEQLLEEVWERQLAEGALQASESKYRNLVETSQDIIWSLDAQGNYTFVNAAVTPICGYEPAEMIGRPFSDFHASELDQKDQQVFQRLLAGESIFQYEATYLTRAGVRVNLVISAMALRDETGAVVGVTGTASDITARKKAEQTLKDRDRLLNGVAAATHRLLTISDFDRSIQQALAALGAAVAANRVYIFENRSENQANSNDVRRLATRRWIWEGDGILSDNDDSVVPDIAYDAVFPDCYQLLSQGRPVAGLVKDFSSPMQRYLESQRTRSILIMPIEIEEAFWGFLGFEDCCGDRYWSDSEKSILWVAVGSLGGAIALHQTELKLRESRQLLQLVMDSIPQHIFWKDKNSVYLGCNRNFAEASGVGAPENIVGKTDYDLAWKQDESDWFRQLDRQVIESNAPLYRVVQPQSHADGSLRWSETSKVPLYNDKDEIVGVLGAFEDVTERLVAQEALRKSEADLRKQTQQLQQTLEELQQTQAQLIQGEKMSSLGQLVAGVAHEINNPVNFIYANLNYADNYTQDLLNLINLYQKHYPNPNPEIQLETDNIDLDFLLTDLPNLLSSMKLGADRIKKIVASLRTFSRMDEAEVKEVDIHEGIDSTLMILQHRLKASSSRSAIAVTQEYGDLPKVECLPGQLNQVFMNLLANAIDALESGDRRIDRRGCRTSQSLPLSTSEPGNRPSPTICIQTQQPDPDFVTIRIADNGPGVPEGIRAKLFDPFFTTKPVGKGTGMGLSISYQIVVEKHGGEFWCESTFGQGTEFVIRIPIRQSKCNLG